MATGVAPGSWTSCDRDLKGSVTLTDSRLGGQGQAI